MQMDVGDINKNLRKFMRLFFLTLSLSSPVFLCTAFIFAARPLLSSV